MLKTCGVEYVIVGHSERRHGFGESDEWINQKIQAVLECGMKPIFCIGETSQERKKVETQSVLVRQLTEGLSGIVSLEKVILAYEPVWAIGTGENAFPEQVEEANRIIRSWIGNFYGVETGDKVSILYGGSVNPENTVALIQTGEIDGFLIGGASLHVESFCSIVQQVDEKY
jgi:triosephosphate isomerase